jgi:hypothetical protein
MFCTNTPAPPKKILRAGDLARMVTEQFFKNLQRLYSNFTRLPAEERKLHFCHRTAH